MTENSNPAASLAVEIPGENPSREDAGRRGGTITRDGWQRTAQGGTYHYDSTPKTSADGVIQTARAPSGLLVSGADITDRSEVTIGGRQMEMRIAVSAGLVERRADGSAVLSEKARAILSGTRPDQQDRQQKQPQEAPVKMDSLGEEAEAEVTQIAQAMRPAQVQAVVNQLAEGKDLPAMAGDAVARALGLADPAEGNAKIAAIREAFEAQAIDAVNATGLDAQEVFHWAYRHAPAEMKNAILMHTGRRSTQGYEAVVREYTANLDKIDPAAVLGAEFGEGVKVRKSSDGSVVVDTPKGTMSWAFAVKKGVIKVGRPL